MMKKRIHLMLHLLAVILILSACKQQTGNTGQNMESFGKNESKSMEMYNKLMSSFNPDWESVDPAPEEYPEYFGGAFIDNDGRFVVCIVGDTAKYKDEVSKIIGSDDFMTESCTYSYREMMQVMDDIDNFLSDENVSHDHPFIVNFAGAVADVFENRVVVRLLEVNDQIVQSFKNDVSNSPAVKFEEGEMPEMM